MAEKALTVDVPSGTLVVFDPAELAHRRAEPPKWSENAAAVASDQAAAKLAAFQAARRGAVHVRVSEAGAAASAAQPLKVSSGRLFFADRAELPSKRWGKRGWNVWDVLFVVFLASLPLFGLWLGGFGERLVWTVVLTALAFIAGLVPITWWIFRYGHDFKRRSGMPPDDSPERVVELPPGDYRVSFEPAADALVVRLTRAPSA